MLYVLECMALGILCMHSGIDMKMYTTGEQPTLKEAGICLICWLFLSLVVLFFIYLIKYVRNKKAHYRSSDKNLAHIEDNDARIKFSSGIIYLLECMALGILCMYSGFDRKLYTTGKKATFKEIIISFSCWVYLSLIIVAIVLIVKF